MDEENDLERRDQLFRKWRSGKPPHQLTPEEDAEEAHLYARIAAFAAARGRDHKRIMALKELGDKCSPAEQSELDALETRYRQVRKTNWPLRAVS